MSSTAVFIFPSSCASCTPRYSYFPTNSYIATQHLLLIRRTLRPWSPFSTPRLRHLSPTTLSDTSPAPMPYRSCGNKHLRHGNYSVKPSRAPSQNILPPPTTHHNVLPTAATPPIEQQRRALKNSELINLIN